MGRLDLPDKPRDEDFCGPDFSDCETAAHLRDCGFCRAVILQLCEEHRIDNLEPYDGD